MEGRRMTTEEILSTLEKMKEEADRYTEIVKQEIEIIDKRLEKKRKRKREKEQDRTLDQQEDSQIIQCLSDSKREERINTVQKAPPEESQEQDTEVRNEIAEIICQDPPEKQQEPSGGSTAEEKKSLNLDELKNEATRLVKIMNEEIQRTSEKSERKRKRKRERETSPDLRDSSQKLQSENVSGEIINIVQKEQTQKLQKENDELINEALEIFAQDELRNIRKPCDEPSKETMNFPDDRPKKHRKITGGEAALKETVERSLHHPPNKIRKPESEVTKGSVALDPDLVSERRRKSSAEDINDTVKQFPQDLPGERGKPSGKDTNDTVKNVLPDITEERRKPNAKAAEETVEPVTLDARKKRGKPRTEVRKKPAASSNIPEKMKENGSDKRKEILTHVNPQAMKLFKSRFMKKKKPIKPRASSHVKPKTGEADKQFREVVDQLKEHMRRRQQKNEDKRLAEMEWD